MFRTPRAFEQLAWTVLVYGIFVIIWGAVVRATGSGAGCGAHWPLCNGDVVPLAPRLTTIIEFAHRSTSGIILLLTVGLVGAAFRTFPPGHLARRAAMASMAASWTGVSVVPGDTALQVTPVPTTSSATARVRPMSAVFVVT